MKFKGKITVILGLQFSQILRFITFLIISAVFTKQSLTHLTRAEVGDWELMMLITAALSYFWVTGIIQSFLPLYNNNPVFPKKTHFREKSPELFNTFLILCLFSFSFALLIYLFRNNIFVYKDLRTIPHAKPLVIYFILSNITPLIEYIYYLRNRPYQIMNYIFWISAVQLVAVCGPVILGLGIEMAIWGLIAISAVRLIWLLVLLERYAKFQFSPAYIKTHLKLGTPLIVSYLLSGSSQYIDGFIASWVTLPSNFAVFRYGAKELPFATSFANGLNNAMLTEFSSPENMRRAMYELKKKSLKLMHYLFPISTLIMLFSKWIYSNLFSLEYLSGSDVFMVYLLMIICRLVFPQTILIGLKKTKIVFWASFFEILLNIAASLFLIQFYGLVGIALGTAFIHIIEKLFMIGYNYYKLGIPPQAYIPLSWYIFYSSLITIVFVLIDHKLILIF